MGCCGSKGKTADIMVAMYGGTLRLLDMQHHVKSFVKLFEEFDEDNSGTIDLVELLDMIDLPKTKFVRKAFRAFDADGSGGLVRCLAGAAFLRCGLHPPRTPQDFREVLFSVWNLCTMDADGLLALTFDLYDQDSSGTMTADELETMVRDVHNAEGNSAVVNRLVGKLRQSRYGGRMTRAQFIEFGRGNSQLLMPALEVQTRTRGAFVSTGFWKDRTRKRLAQREAKWNPAHWTQLRAALMSTDMQQRARQSHVRQGGE